MEGIFEMNPRFSTNNFMVQLKSCKFVKIKFIKFNSYKEGQMTSV